jgi:cytidine deaminase
MLQNDSFGELSPAQIHDLEDRAREVAANAYAPYSRFRVGAAVLLTDGNIVSGCNIENSSYRLTCCAEQSAIAVAVAMHGPSISIRAIVVTNLNDSPSAPCGACRQTILEFASANTEVFYPSTDGSLARSTISNLLPQAFLLEERTR